MLVAGDFSQANLESTMPEYKQYVTIGFYIIATAK